MGCQSLIGDAWPADAKKHLKKTRYNWFQCEVAKGTVDNSVDDVLGNDNDDHKDGDGNNIDGNNSGSGKDDSNKDNN